jgi:hypothetical protein
LPVTDKVSSICLPIKESPAQKIGNLWAVGIAWPNPLARFRVVNRLFPAALARKHRLDTGRFEHFPKAGLAQGLCRPIANAAQAAVRNHVGFLQPCPDCGKEISKRAVACPNCGRRANLGPAMFSAFLWAAFAIAVTGLIVFVLLHIITQTSR